MKNIIIYHGSENIIERPIYQYFKSNNHNDYGYGFYTTLDKDIAKEWANRKNNSGYLNVYSFNDDGLKILDLTDANKYSVLNWIAILLHFRDLRKSINLKYRDELAFLKQYYIDVLLYDVVIGYRADDAYFRFPLMFIQNKLTLDKLGELYLYGNLGKQYVLISKESFNRIEFLRAVKVENYYHDFYLNRINDANKSYNELEKAEMINNGLRIKDLMKL